MRKLLAAVMLVMMLGVSAFADVIYTTDSGTMGRIRINGSDSVDLHGTLYTGIAEDSYLGSYWDGGESRIIVVDRTTDTTTSGDTALIFDPANMTQPLNTTPKVLTGVYGTHAMIGSYNGRGLFFASGASIHEFSTEDFSLSRSYTYTPKTSEDITPRINAMLTGTYTVYALVEQENSRDVLLIFDGQLRDDTGRNFSRYTMPFESETMTWLNGALLTVGHADGVSYWRTTGYRPVVSSDAPVKSLCRDSENGFYFAEEYESGDVYTTTLKHYSDRTEEVTTLRSETGRAASQLLYDERNALLAAITGSKIVIYRMRDDALLAEYDRTSLGGLPTNIAMSYVNGDDGKTSSGCNLSGMGMMILFAGVMILRRR